MGWWDGTRDTEAPPTVRSEPWRRVGPAHCTLGAWDPWGHPGYTAPRPAPCVPTSPSGGGFPCEWIQTLHTRDPSSRSSTSRSAASTQGQHRRGTRATSLLSE
ncbi:unnamed protein product [Gadus morhua 'NCC']